MKHALETALRAVVMGSLLAVLFFLVIFVTGCADTNKVVIDQRPVTNVYNSYYTIQEITEIYEGCNVEQLQNGLVMTCSDGSQALVYNGVDGQDGSDGQDGQDGLDGQNSAVLAVIPLCPDLNGDHKEVVFKTTSGLVAYFTENSSALKARLTILEQGFNYTTTDSNNKVCKFSINSNNEIIYK